MFMGHVIKWDPIFFWSSLKPTTLKTRGIGRGLLDVPLILQLQNRYETQVKEREKT